MTLFVWIASQRGPSPQIWHGDHTRADGTLPTHLAKHEIMESEADLPISELMKCYPAPEIKNAPDR